MSKFEADRLRRDPSIRPESFNKKSQEFFKGADRFKAERIVKALGGSGLHKTYQTRHKLEALFEKAEEQGLKMTTAGKEMKKSLDAGSDRLVDKLVHEDTQERIDAIEDDKGPTKEELRREKRREDVLKKRHQGELAEQREEEEEKAAAAKSRGKTSTRHPAAPPRSSNLAGGIPLPRRGSEGGGSPTAGPEQPSRGDASSYRQNFSPDRGSEEEPLDMAID